MFRLTKELPKEALASCIKGQDQAAQLALMEGAIDHCPAEYRVRLECARVVLLHDLGQREEAIEALRRIAVKHLTNDRVQCLLPPLKRLLGLA
jgi:hypothetical protein